MLTEGFQEEIYSESQAPTGEDIDLQGFLPLKFLGNTYDFSLEPLSGAAGDQRRREKIIRFAFFACQTVWVGEEKFIYFDRSTNTFTHENITNVVTNPQLYVTQEPIVENSYTKAQLIKQPEPTAHENIFEFSPDSRERSSNMNLANEDYDEDEDDLGEIILFNPQDWNKDEQNTQYVGTIGSTNSNLKEKSKEYSNILISTSPEPQNVSLKIVGVPLKFQVSSQKPQTDILGIGSPLESYANHLFTRDSFEMVSPQPTQNEEIQRSPFPSTADNSHYSNFSNNNIWNSSGIGKSSFFQNSRFTDYPDDSDLLKNMNNLDLEEDDAPPPGFSNSPQNYYVSLPLNQGM